VSASASLLSELQDLALRFTGLSRTKLIFPGFLGPGNFTNTILDFPESMGTLTRTMLAAVAGSL